MEKQTHLVVTQGGIKQLLPVDEILYVKAARIYSVFYMRSSTQQYVSSQNIGKILQQLNPEQFMRVHKSHVVNLLEVKIYQSAKGGMLVMSDDKEIEVSQRRKKELLQHLWRVNKKAQIVKMKIKNDPRATVRLNPHRPTLD